MEGINTNFKFHILRQLSILKKQDKDGKSLRFLVFKGLRNAKERIFNGKKMLRTFFLS